MGLFNRLFGSKKKSRQPTLELKAKLIRSLIKKRVLQDPLAAQSGYTAEMVDTLPEVMLMGLPEATIVAIVDAFAELRAKGLNEGPAIAEIERRRLGGRLPAGINLD